MAFERKYGVATAAGTHIRIPIPKAGLRDFADSGDWTPAAGDVKISKDGGSLANIGTLPTYTNGAWQFVFTATENQAATIEVQIVDSATKAIEDQFFIIETYGHASALHEFDRDTSIEDIVDLIWDEVLTGSTHNIPTSSGRRLRQLTGIVYTDGTGQAGGVNTITLAAGESAQDNIYRQSYIGIVGGTGAGQGHHILAYNGTSKVAVIDDDWVVQPDATSEYVIFGSGSHDENGEGQAQAGAASTITLDPTASAIDDTYNKAWVVIVSGTGVGQARRISDETGYNGTTKVATVTEDWVTQPDATSGYFIRANAEVEKAVWDRPLTGSTHNETDSAGKRLRELQEFGTYEGGAVFIDTIDGAAGTTNYENGTNLNPVDNLPDATTIAVALNLKIFHIVTGSTITLAQTYNNFFFRGHGWTLALGGQDIGGTHIEGPAGVSGIGTGATEVEFHDCSIGNVTVNETHFLNCGFSGTVTMAAATDYEVTNGYSIDNTTAIFDFGAAVANIDFNATNWQNKIELQNMGQAGTDTANIGGCGDIILNANCIAGTVEICGNITLTNNGSGQTINDDARIDTGQVKDAILPKINTALDNIEFLFVAASDHVTPVVGATGIAVARSIDGGAYSAGAGTLAEVGDGTYQYDASAADMNGGIITFRFTATGGTPDAPDARYLTIVTGAGV